MLPSAKQSYLRVQWPACLIFLPRPGLFWRCFQMHKKIQFIYHSEMGFNKCRPLPSTSVISDKTEVHLSGRWKRKLPRTLQSSSLTWRRLEGETGVSCMVLELALLCTTQECDLVSSFCFWSSPLSKQNMHPYCLLLSLAGCLFLCSWLVQS